jgi:hypothetical protein
MGCHLFLYVGEPTSLIKLERQEYKLQFTFLVSPRPSSLPTGGGGVLTTFHSGTHFNFLKSPREKLRFLKVLSFIWVPLISMILQLAKFYNVYSMCLPRMSVSHSSCIRVTEPWTGSARTLANGYGTQHTTASHLQI